MCFKYLEVQVKISFWPAGKGACVPARAIRYCVKMETNLHRAQAQTYPSPSPSLHWLGSLLEKSPHQGFHLESEPDGERPLLIEENYRGPDEPPRTSRSVYVYPMPVSGVWCSIAVCDSKTSGLMGRSVSRVRVGALPVRLSKGIFVIRIGRNG